MRFGKKGKLSPRFIGPYEVIIIIKKKSGSSGIQISITSGLGKDP